MERFTNDRNRYINQIQFELLDFIAEKQWKTILEYAEIPFFLDYAFSYNLSINLKDNRIRLLSRDWNAKYDNTRFKNGIYNLDRLAITENEINLCEEKVNLFRSINIDKLDTVKFEGFVLDGLICELRTMQKEKNLQWNIDDEMNTELASLINLLRNIKWQKTMQLSQ